jgi:membrane-bound serine protease (ClpP class)
MLATTLLLVASSSALAARSVPTEGKGRVLVAPLTGTVDPVMLEFVERVIDQAESDGYDAIVFELDTPGGLSTSMDDIVRDLVATDLPVYVYVSPSGGRAASAGVFITYASDVAAMAPGTNIGSATPISSGGEELPKDLRKKVINDAVARITELAAERDRDAEFAKAAIVDAENVGARAALKSGVVEYIADDVRDLLTQSDGTTVTPKNLELNLKDAKIERSEVPWTLKVLKKIVDPNLLYLLFGAGLLGLAFEITHPGTVLPGVVGGICLLLALFGLSVLPASGAGIALLVLSAALFAAEAIAPGGGIMGVGGAVSMLLGALLLFDDSSGYGVSPTLAIVVAFSLGAFFVFVLRKAVQTRRLPKPTDATNLIGMVGDVKRAISDDVVGSVYVDGELWQATSDDTLDIGQPAEVVGVDGLTVRVRPATETTTSDAGVAG